MKNNKYKENNNTELEGNSSSNLSSQNSLQSNEINIKQNEKTKTDNSQLSAEQQKAKKVAKKQKILRTSITALIFIAVCLAIYLPLQLTGTLAKIDSAEELKALILSGGMWSYGIFFVFQFLQATILPIPAMVTTVAGALVFGPWIASLLSFLAILSASIFMFYLGRKIGKKLLNWIIGEEDALKWEEKLGKGKFVFFLMMLFPLFPDDILCLVAGTTAISFRFFLITMLIARPIGIIGTCFFGSGMLIPFSGWGIPVWIILAAVMVFAFYASIKWQKQIEAFVTNLGAKLGFGKKKETEKEKTSSSKNYNVNINNNEEKSQNDSTKASEKLDVKNKKNQNKFNHKNMPKN